MIKKNAKIKKNDQTTLISAIDIGSVSIRMDIAEITDENNYPKIIERLVIPAATGADTFKHGYITTQTLNAICEVLKNFKRLLNDYGVFNKRIFATSAVREAENKDIIADRVKYTIGAELEILDSVEESRLVYQALLPWLHDPEYNNEYSITLNVGGGSTEIMLLKGEDLLFGSTRRLGMSRMFHLLGKSAGGQEKLEILSSYISKLVDFMAGGTYTGYDVKRFLLINQLLYRAFRKEPEALINKNDYKISAEILKIKIPKLVKVNAIDLSKKISLGMADIELLIPAMLILYYFLEITKVEEVTFVDTEVITGFLAEMTMQAKGEKPLMNFHRQIVRSASAIGEKYHYDKNHAKVVTEYALRLFSVMAPVLELNDNDMLILEVAAVLHDIGKFISERDHHVHSAYLIKWSEIVGLSEDNRMLVALLARFHRKETPSEKNNEFAVILPENRMKVRKLTAILRIAEALDRGHVQQIKNMRAEINENKIFIYVQATSDISLIAESFAKKTELLEQITGLPVILRREALVL